MTRDTFELVWTPEAKEDAEKIAKDPAKIGLQYVQNNTPQAHRILWVYGPKAKQITIVAIMAHY